MGSNSALPESHLKSSLIYSLTDRETAIPNHTSSSDASTDLSSY